MIQPKGAFSWANCDKARVALTGVDLGGADLVGANLIGADLLGADLLAADFSGANMRATTSWHARYDARTVWPEDFTSPVDATGEQTP